LPFFDHPDWLIPALFSYAVLAIFYPVQCNPGIRLMIKAQFFTLFFFFLVRGLAV
jgi:hypothetical protein